MRLATSSACFVVLLLLPASGCVSARGAYRGGMEAEVSGDYDAAVTRYTTALRRDGSLPNVRGRLQVASREAVRAHLTRAASVGPVEGATAWLAAEHVVTEARSVGVDAARPATFDADLADALDGAVVAILTVAAGRVDGRDYPGALAALEQARLYRPSQHRQAELDATAQAAYSYWADDDLAAGRFRDALAHADAALALTPPGEDADRLAALRVDAIDAGTVVVALLSIQVDGRGDLPAGFLRDLDDLLDERLATGGGPFVALVDPADVRRALRGRGARPGGVLGTDAAASVARDLDADLAVTVDLGPPAETLRETQRRRVRSRLRIGRDTTSYLQTTTRVELAATARIRVVEAGTRRVVCTEESRQTATADAREAIYRGNWRDLDLDRAERDRFAEDEVDRARAEAFVDLRAALANDLARRAADCLNRQIP